MIKENVFSYLQNFDSSIGNPTDIALSNDHSLLAIGNILSYLFAKILADSLHYNIKILDLTNSQLPVIIGKTLKPGGKDGPFE